MAVQKQNRQVGDRLTAIAATLERPDGTAVDLTSKTVKFKMVDSKDGTDKVAETETGVTVTSATDGECQYAPAAIDVDTEGLYYGYFTVTSGGLKDTFPAKKGEFEINIMASV